MKQEILGESTNKEIRRSTRYKPIARVSKIINFMIDNFFLINDHLSLNSDESIHWDLHELFINTTDISLELSDLMRSHPSAFEGMRYDDNTHQLIFNRFDSITNFIHYLAINCNDSMQAEQLTQAFHAFKRQIQQIPGDNESDPSTENPDTDTDTDADSDTDEPVALTEFQHTHSYHQTTQRRTQHQYALQHSFITNDNVFLFHSLEQQQFFNILHAIMVNPSKIQINIYRACSNILFDLSSMQRNEKEIFLRFLLPALRNNMPGVEYHEEDELLSVFCLRMHSFFLYSLTAQIENNNAFECLKVLFTNSYLSKMTLTAHCYYKNAITANASGITAFDFSLLDTMHTQNHADGKEVTQEVQNIWRLFFHSPKNPAVPTALLDELEIFEPASDPQLFEF